ncbi:hypothetical protein EPIR_0723 [Erwinia piriflorinigrans CFBP 5888]|uniref:Uncharacterized protein n=1 Tax=Erwinia piriflorinigrans CFBP 5888 TaxID=1161919 RepID=V5Z555_9GAMM|nr:hypothetical protein EPIR_0723 [Erwinia piriflorinigrans CFBP 5888]
MQECVHNGEILYFSVQLYTETILSQDRGVAFSVTALCGDGGW